MIKPFLTIVVPCFNEEEVFIKTSNQLTAVVTDLIPKEGNFVSLFKSYRLKVIASNQWGYMAYR
jgi:hypothetical protein